MAAKQNLTPRDVELCLEMFAKGLQPSIIASKTNYSLQAVKQVTNTNEGYMSRVEVNKTIVKRASVSKQDVLEGYLEAIDMARTQADPLVMISGWEKVARLMGYNEPDKVVTLNAHTDQELVTMSNEELMQIIEGEYVEDKSVLPIGLPDKGKSKSKRKSKK